LLRLLLVDYGYRIEIHEKKARGWECSIKASPGNLKVWNLVRLY
jgi:hypothetical protein